MRLAVVVRVLRGAVAEDPLDLPLVGGEEVVGEGWGDVMFWFGRGCGGECRGGRGGAGEGQDGLVVQEWVGGVGDQRGGREVIGFDCDHFVGGCGSKDDID